MSYRRALPLLAVLAGCGASDGVLPTPSADLALRPQNPDEAMRWRSLRRRDSNGHIPPGGHARALAARQANLEYWKMLKGPTAGLDVARWVERGPTNVGGRTRHLVIDPRDSNHLWAGAVGGGLWESDDAGQTWTPVDDQLANLAVNAIVLDPTNPDVMYVGTGEGYFNADAVVGQGVFKSIDGGKTFQHLASTATWQYVNRLAISPTTPTTLFAALRPGGVARSDDAGLSWRIIVPGYAAMQVEINPLSPSNIVADVLEYPGSGGYAAMYHRVVYSTDGGNAWFTTQQGLSNMLDFNSRIELAFSKKTIGTIYASCGANGGEVWRSLDFGASFWLATNPGQSTSVGWYYNALWVDPTDDNTLLVGAYHIQRSTDGGQTFSQISNGYILTSDPHPDVHRFVADIGFNGDTNKKVYVTTDGGAFYTDNVYAASPGFLWTPIYNGYRTTQFYGAAGDGRTGVIIGGTQDNGTLKLTSTSTSAHLTYGGDGGFCEIDPDDGRYTYGEYVWLQLHRSTNGGQSARSIYGGIPEAQRGQANFIAPFLLDPADPKRMLAGAQSLWLTDDARASSVSWRAIKTATSTPISAIAVAPTDSNVIWVGHNDGLVYKTTDGLATSPTWTVIDDNVTVSPVPDRYIGRIVVSNTDPNTVYVATGGYTPDNLWRTTDGGTSFQQVTGTGAASLPPAPINGLAEHPDVPGHLYAATEVGLFASADGGGRWSTSNLGPASVSVDEVRFMHGSRTLLLASHGRGLWTADIFAAYSNPYGAGCGPTLSAVSPPAIGGLFILTATNLQAGLPVVLFLGGSNTVWNGSPLPLDLGFAGMPGCQVLASLDVGLPQTPAGTSAAVVLNLPNNPWMLGQTIYSQLVAADPGANNLGVTTSNGVASTLGY